MLQGTGRQALFGFSVAWMALALYMIFLWVPTDKNLGVVQRIFYIHVPLAWVGFLAFFVLFIASIAYLWQGRAFWDALAYSAGELGVMFTTLMITTGILWAKPVWGIWWTWDPRLTTSLVLWLIYVAYLMLRAYAPNRSWGARYAAVLGIVGFVDVPIVYLSIVWWRTLHPQPVVGPLSTPGSLHPAMFQTLMVSLVAFTVLFAFLLWQRFSLRVAEAEVEGLRALGRL